MLNDGDPTGEVSAVCWKLLYIAGAGFGVLSSVIVILAKKLWESMLARESFKNEIIAQLQAAQNYSKKKGEPP